MYGTGVWCYVKMVSCYVDRTEVFGRINKHSINLLYARYGVQSLFQQELGGDANNSGLFLLVCLNNEVPSLVAVKQLFHQTESRDHPKAEARINRRSGGTVAYSSRTAGMAVARLRLWVGLHAHERTASDDVVKRTNDLHIGVEIQSAILVQYPKAGIIRDESIFSCSVGLTGVWDDVDIEITLVPTFDFIVRQILPP